MLLEVVLSRAFKRIKLGLLPSATHLLPRAMVLSEASQATEKPKKTLEKMGREKGSGCSPSERQHSFTQQRAK